MPFEIYVVESMNRMDMLLAKSEIHPEQKKDYVLEAALVGCRTLGRLCDDPELVPALDQFSDVRLIVTYIQKTTTRAKRSQRNRVQAFRSIIEDPTNFEHFLTLEREVLLKGGVAPDVVDLLIEQSQEAIDEVRARAKPPSEVLERVRLLRDRACVLSNDLIAEAVADNSWEGIKEKIKRVLLGLGGTAIIGLNASSLAGSVGITAVGSAVSAALGATVLQMATADKAKARGATK